MDWTTACPDWRERIVAGKSLLPVGPLFQSEADEAMSVFDDLLIVDAAGSPRMGDIARPWIRDWAATIFGAYDPEEGRRLINQFFLLISKKNGKSTTAAGLMVTALIRNWRESGEFGILAPTIEAADNAFKPARDMCRRNPVLNELMHVQEHIRTITHRTTGATLKVVAADSDAVSGKKWIGTLVDELWGFGKQAKAEDMLLEATGGMASRPEGFVVYLSTHSNEPPAGVFRQKLMYARGVRDGRIKDRKFLPVLYEFPEKMIEAGQHKEPANFYVTNPNLGLSVDEEFLLTKLSEGQENGEESLRGFLAKHLNVEIGLALGTDRWAGANHWEKCKRAFSLEELLEQCEVVTIGIDGGGLDDLLGFVVLGRTPTKLSDKTGNWLCWAHAWCHEDVLTLRKSEAPKFRDFEKAGELTIIKAPGDDITELGDYVEQVEASGLLDRIGVDQAGIGAIVEEIQSRDIEFERIIGIPQGWRLVGAIKTAERKLAEGKLLHGGQGVMAYSVGNAKVEPRGNAVMITKQTAGAAKIDPLMALFDAVALMCMNPEPRSKSYQLLFAG